ncbi:FAD-binding oxidoreductase [Chloroflexota bacterium]
MSIKDRLAKIVGSDNVSDAPDVIDSHSRDFSLSSPGLFSCLVRPKTAEEVQKIIQLANELKFSVTPSSSGVHFYGDAIPRMGGVVLDLRRMNSVKEIDEMSRAAHLEPGVTWEQFQTELEKKGYRSIMPLLPHASRSVVTDWLEREQPTTHVTEYAEPTMSMQVIWGNGEEFVTGSASINNFRQPECLADGVNPMGPGTVSFWRFLQGAQGTMGVVTWGIVKFEEIPTITKTFFMPVDKVENAIEPLYTILRRRIGYECLLLNNITLATILTEKGPEQFNELRATLAPWTVILVIGALKRRPEEKIAYEEEALQEIRMTQFPALKLLTTLPGLTAVEKRIPEMLRKPWPKNKTYWKHAYRGGCQDLMFMTTLDRVSSFIPAVMEVAGRNQYPVSDVGCYVQPVENGRACQLQFNFYYNPGDVAEVEKMRRIYAEAASRVLELGAYFNRPYGPVADIVYRQNGDYTALLKRLKTLFDPNYVLNPGNLCF